ncbi:MAG: flavodoxin [Alistipes indistinctus]
MFVGSPCWWYTIAPPVATFLSSYDLSGKTIAPFMTHEGSRMGHSEADIKTVCRRDFASGIAPSGAAACKRPLRKWPNGCEESE